MNQNVAFSNNYTHHNIIQFIIGHNFEHRLFENIAWIVKIGSIGNYKTADKNFTPNFLELYSCYKYENHFSKIIQIIGAVCVALVVHYHNKYNLHYYNGYFAFELFFLLMATTFLIGTFCLLISCLFSLSTGGIISKTIYVSEIMSIISLNNEI